MAISLTENLDSLWTTTMKKYRKKLTDNIFRSNVLLMLLDGKGRKIYEDGGEKIVEPVIFAENTNVASFDKYDIVPVDSTEELTSALFDWKFIYGAVTISDAEILKNS